MWETHPIRVPQKSQKRMASISPIKTCRQLGIADFHQFDFIFAMDQSNITNAKLIKPKPGSAQLALFTQFANLGDNIEIPDPYYGGADGFENAYQMIKQASIGALDRLFA